MKDFEERKAEVLRRADIGIKAKKRHRRLLMASAVPSAFCILLVSAFVGISVGSSMDKAPENTYSEGDGVLDAEVIDHVSVFSFDGYYELYGDATTVDNIRLVISDIINTPCKGTTEDPEDKYSASIEDAVPETLPVVDGDVPSGTEVPDDTDSTVNGMEYTEAPKKNGKFFSISLTSVAGKTTVYELRGNVLVDIDTGEEYTLSESKLAELEDVLGIS